VGLVDQSYQPWAGAREGRAQRIAALVRAGLGLAFEGTLTRLVLILCYSTVVVFLGVIYFAEAMGAPWRFLIGNNLYREYLDSRPYGLLIMLLTAVVGARLVSRDLKTDATAMYFSKGITRGDYLIGKLAIVLIFLLSASLVPSIVLWAGQIELGAEDIGWAARLRDLASLTTHTLLIVVPASAAILALSSLSRTAFVPGVIWVLLYLGSQILSELLRHAVGENRWVAFSWRELVQSLSAVLYEDRPFVPKPGSALAEAYLNRMHHGVRKHIPPLLDWKVAAAALLAITVISLLAARVRLSRAEGRE
jgi:hypothetical protein